MFHPLIEVAASNELPPAKTETSDGMLRCDRVKIFADGSLGACTAALREPYKFDCIDFVEP